MELDKKIVSIVQLGKQLKKGGEEWEATVRVAEATNRWFTQESIQQAVEEVSEVLSEDNLRSWMEMYAQNTIPVSTPKKIGVVMAGNIPMVGFHDFLSVLLSGHILYAKLSTQDAILLKDIAAMLVEIEPAFERQIFFVDLLKEADAFIATGSDNSARYFEYYFSKKPHIIRRNRNSCAILQGSETQDDLRVLGKDIFQYFGLGCRSISKLYVPEEYDFIPFFEAIEEYKPVINHSKYVNNYDYQKAIYLVNQTPHQDNGFLLVAENKNIASPTGMLYYETYQNEQELQQKLRLQEEKIQVIVSRQAWYSGSVAFGQAQKPALWDYADGVDTMQFLLNI